MGAALHFLSVAKARERVDKTQNMAENAAVEQSLSAVVTLLTFLLGWIRAFAICESVTVQEIVDADYLHLLWITLRMLAPYLEMWAVVLAGILILIIVDCNLVMIAGLLPNGRLTMGDGYATLVFMDAFWNWRVVLAMMTTMMVVVFSSMAFMYYIKVQRRVHRFESVLRRGLVLIHIFGVCLGLCMLIVQGFFVR